MQMGSKMNTLKKLYDIAKNQEAQSVNIAPSTRVVTTPLVVSSVFIIIGGTLVLVGPDHPYFRVTTAIVNDRSQSLPPNTKKDRGQDQSSLMEENLAKRTRLSEGSASGSATSLLKFPTILHFRIPHTPQEATSAMYEDDLSYLQKFSKEDKMKLFS